MFPKMFPHVPKCSQSKIPKPWVQGVRSRLPLQPPGNSLAAAWQQPGSSLAAASQQPGSSLAAAWQQPDSSLAAAWQQLNLKP